MTTTKKEFQKVIKEIRGDKKFPKPIMTQVQIEKREATVNCGGEWKSAEETKEIANNVLKSERFKAFIKENNATAKLELNNFNTWQIRINF